MRVPDELLTHLRRTRDRIDRGYAKRLDLDALAAEANVSKYHFLQEPAERPYGVEAVCRDNSGNWLVLIENREYGA